MSDDDEDHTADQRPTKSHPGIAEVCGKWVPRIHFLRQKYDFGKFDTEDEAELAYKSMISRVKTVLSGKKPRPFARSSSDDEDESPYDDYFESAEWRIQMLEEDLVRLRKSEASATTRLSLADARVRCAKEEAKKAETSSTQAKDEIASLKTSGRKLRKERDQAQTELKKVKKERDEANAELKKVKEQPQARAAQGGAEQARQLKEVQAQLTAAQSERNQVRAELRKVKDHLGAVQKERDQARTELGSVKDQLQAGAAQGGAEQARQLKEVQAQLIAAQSERNNVRAELGKGKEQLGAVQKDGDEARTELGKVKEQLRAVQKERNQARMELGKVKIVLESVSEELSDVKKMRLQTTKSTEVVPKQEGGKKALKPLSLDLGVVVCKSTVKEHDAVKMEPDACTNLGKRTRNELQDGSDVVRIKRELETQQEKNLKLQLALDIKATELEKALKRRRTCDCAVEVVDVVD